MTEERIKELVEEYYGSNTARNTFVGGGMEIEDLIRTVAAGAREEGIDEMRDAMLPLLVFQDKKVIEEQAERLKKEKGSPMNLSDSKLDRNSLEELREQHRRGIDSLAAHQALINGLEYHLAEQDREIARLTFQVKGLSVERTSAKQRTEKAEVDMMVFLDAKQKIEAQWAEEYNKREKAEAELAICRKQEMANLEGFNACAAERFDLKIRVKELKELMQEAVFDDWFCQNEPDFMDRWNKALAEKEKV